MKFLFKRGDRFSMSKTWTNVSYGVATFVVVRNADHPSWEILLVYLAVVGASEIAKRLLEAKYGLGTQGAGAPAASSGSGVEGVQVGGSGRACSANGEGRGS